MAFTMLPLLLLPFAGSAPAALPFLPAGEGALILIFGGLAVLPFSLLLSRASVNGHRWTAGLAGRAQEEGVGPCRLLATTARECVVRVEGCLTCRVGHARGAAGCRREAAVLLRAAQVRAPAARVAEVACNHRQDGACTFIVHRGAAP